mgnify:CR=1 FL=1
MKRHRNQLTNEVINKDLEERKNKHTEKTTQLLKLKIL